MISAMTLQAIVLVLVLAASFAGLTAVVVRAVRSDGLSADPQRPRSGLPRSHPADFFEPRPRW
jgi:hypothetical protein